MAKCDWHKYKKCDNRRTNSRRCSRKDSIDMTSNKSNFVKFYTQGCLLGLIDDKPENISQHYLDDFKKKFSITFKHLFIESNFAESKPHISILDSKKAAKMKKLVDEKFITPNFIADVMKDSIYFDKKLDIDFDNPNKIIKQKDGAIRDESQLMYCAYMEQVDNVKKLIQKGANVNYIRKYDNSTALLHMMTKDMMYARMSDKQIEIAKILIPLMSKEAIDSRLNKRKETALSLAIYYGEVSLVEMLINNNADIESKIHTPDNLTALYYSLICINQAKNGINFKRLDSMYWDKDKQKRLVSSNPMFSSGVFKDDYTKAFELIMNMWRSQEYQEISKKIHNIILKPKLESYYRIFDILCQKPQDINIECVNGCSALLFACEINETTLAKKLLDKGANKYHKQKAGYTAYDYASRNYNIELMSLLIK